MDTQPDESCQADAKRQKLLTTTSDATLDSITAAAIADAIDLTQSTDFTLPASSTASSSQSITSPAGTSFNYSMTSRRFMNEKILRLLLPLRERLAKRSQYYFLLGLQLLQLGYYSAAIEALEQADALATAQAKEYAAVYTQLITVAHEKTKELKAKEDNATPKDQEHQLFPTDKTQHGQSAQQGQAANMNSQDASSSSSSSNSLPVAAYNPRHHADIKLCLSLCLSRARVAVAAQSPLDVSVLKKTEEENHRAKLLLEQALELAGDGYRSDLWNHVALFHVENGELKEALHTYDALLSTFSLNLDLWNNFGVLCLIMNDSKKALLSFQHILAMDPHHLEAVNNFAALISQVETLAAIQLMEFSLKHHPRQPHVWASLALLYGKVNAIDKANAAADKAQVYEACDVNTAWTVRFAVAQHLIHAAKLQTSVTTNRQMLLGAVNLLQSVITLKPTVDAWTSLALCQMYLSTSVIDHNNTPAVRLAWKKQAETSILAALKLHPYDTQAWTTFGLLSLYHEEYNEAERYFQELVKALDGSDAAAILCNLGITLQLNSKLNEAEQAYLKATTLHSSLPSVWNNLGNLYRQMQQVDKALAAYDKAIELDKYYAMAYCNKALVCVMKDELEKALALLDQALFIHPELQPAIRNKEIIYKMHIKRQQELPSLHVVHPHLQQPQMQTANI